MPVDDPTNVRIEGDAGAYTLITYLDLESFSAVPKSRATGAAVAEYDADDLLLTESIGSIAPPSV